MQKPNFQKQMEQTIVNLEKAQETPRLLLHSCCAPCSSAVLERLSSHFQVTVFYDNPNISPKEEYQKRVEEQKRLLTVLPTKNSFSFLEADYQPERFYQTVKGLETEPEGGARCAACFHLRLEDTARVAKEKNFSFFTTTLSVSPHKNADKLVEIGLECAHKYGVHYLVSDFKKKNGYLRSIQLSTQYHLYRQNFCGCVFSKRGEK